MAWQVTTNLPPMADLDAVTTTAASMGLDLDSDEKSRAKKLLYVPAVVAMEGGQSSAELAEPAAVSGADLPTTMPGVFRARSVQTAHGTFGHLRIFTFNVDDPIAFRDEFARLAGQLPQNGLIVDVRDNGGGSTADLLLTAIHPEWQAKGVSAILITELQKVMYEYGVTHAETTGIIETNEKAISHWKNYDHIQHKRKRCFIKMFTPNP